MYCPLLEYLLLKAQLLKFGIILHPIASWLNPFEVPVAHLTPLFRRGFPSFDPNKKTTHEYVMLLQWVSVTVTHKKGPMSLSVKHLFVCLVWRIKQSWFTVMFSKGWTQIWDFFVSYLSVVISTLTSGSIGIHFVCLFTLLLSLLFLSCSL